VAEEPGPAWPGPGAAGRAGDRGRKVRGAGVHGQERRIAMALMVAGFVAGGMRIDTAVGGGCELSVILRADYGTGDDGEGRLGDPDEIFLKILCFHH